MSRWGTGFPTVEGLQPAARINVRLGAAPIPVAGADGQKHLAYELHVTETSGLQDVAFERLDMLAERAVPTLAAYGASDLDERVMRPNTSPADRYGRLIRRGTTVIVHVWISLPRGQAIPKIVLHRLTFSAALIDGAVAEVRADVLNFPPIVLGPPLRGGPWFAHNGPGAHRAAHWGSVLMEPGRARIPQRYAIDFIGLDATGRAVRGDIRGSSNADRIGFGAEVLAVVDGIVREARDGLADHVPLQEPPPPAGAGLPFVGGNYVVLELSGRRFVHYLHLQQGSVSVQPGQRVRRGQTLGRLGNSGNTNGAHLHFNVLDAVSMEEGEGVPFVFDSLDLSGTTTPEAALGKGLPQTSSPARIRRALPLNGAVVRFPGRR